MNDDDGDRPAEGRPRGFDEGFGEGRGPAFGSFGGGRGPGRGFGGFEGGRPDSPQFFENIQRGQESDRGDGEGFESGRDDGFRPPFFDRDRNDRGSDDDESDEESQDAGSDEV